jgi:hypothetical protein
LLRLTIVRGVVTVFLLIGLAHADALSDLRAREAEVVKRDGERAQADKAFKKLSQEGQALAADIEKLKAEPAGVRRDFRLQELLADAKAKSDALEKLSAEQRAKAAPLANARRALVAACDRALGAQLPEATRLELSRLRTAQVTLLTLPAAPLGKPQVEADPLDGPRELSEKADLLRDSEDKLRREVGRLARRIDDVERRRHLRERAGAVDEDWFGEATSNRRVARVAGVGAAGAGRNSESADKAAAADPGRGAAAPNSPPPAQSPSPAPGGFAGGGATGTGGGSGGTGTGGGGIGAGGSFSDSPASAGRADSSSVLRNLVDPSTLAELRSADGSDDLERQLRALRRAQGELEGMAKDLGRRAQSLSSRAADLKKQK